MPVKYAKNTVSNINQVYSTETNDTWQFFIMKQSIIIYKIYKQDLVVWNRVSFSTNALPIG